MPQSTLQSPGDKGVFVHSDHSRAVNPVTRESVAAENKAFLKNGAIVFAAQMAVNLLNFAFHFLISRRIGVQAYGALNALIAGFMLFSVPAIILTTITVKYAAEFHASGDSSRLRSLTMRASALLLGLALLTFLTGALASGIIATYLRIGDAMPVILMAGILALNIALPMRGFLQGMEDFRSFSISLVLEAALKVALAVLFTAKGFGLNGALWGWLIGLAIACVYTYAAVLLKNKGIASGDFSIDLGKLIRTSANVTLVTLFVTSLGFSDVVVVKHFFDPVEAGLYGAAALTGKMLFLLVSFVPAVLLPRVARLVTDGKATTTALLQALAAVAVPAGLGLFCYAMLPKLVVTTLAGKDFAAAAPLIFPYGIASTLLSLLNTLVFYRIGIHRFAFRTPLMLVAIGELAAISICHQSALQVIEILAVSNALGIATTLYGLYPKTSDTDSSTVRA